MMTQVLGLAKSFMFLVIAALDALDALASPEAGLERLLRTTHW